MRLLLSYRTIHCLYLHLKTTFHTIFSYSFMMHAFSFKLSINGTSSSTCSLNCYGHVKDTEKITNTLMKKISSQISITFEYSVWQFKTCITQQRYFHIQKFSYCAIINFEKLYTAKSQSIYMPTLCSRAIFSCPVLFFFWTSFFNLLVECYF